MIYYPRIQISYVELYTKSISINPREIIETVTVPYLNPSYFDKFNEFFKASQKDKEIQASIYHYKSHVAEQIFQDLSMLVSVIGNQLRDAPPYAVDKNPFWPKINDMSKVRSIRHIILNEIKIVKAFIERIATTALDASPKENFSLYAKIHPIVSNFHYQGDHDLGRNFREFLQEALKHFKAKAVLPPPVSSAINDPGNSASIPKAADPSKELAGKTLPIQAAQPQLIKKPEQIAGVHQQQTITNGQSIAYSVFSKYPFESLPIDQLIQAGFFLLNKAGMCSKPIYNIATVMYNGPFVENLAKTQEQERSAELKLNQAGSSLEAALYYFFDKEHINGDQHKKLQQRRFLVDIINGNVERDIINEFNQFANTENALERTQQMTELMEKFTLQQINNARWDKVITIDTGCSGSGLVG